MKYFALIHVYIILHCVRASSSSKKDGYIINIQNEQDITINQKPGNPYERFPDTFSIWLQYGENSVRHELLRDDVISKALFPVLFRLSSYLPDDLMTEENTKHFAFYRNEDMETSSLHTHFVLYRQDPDSAALLYGQILIDDKKYKIYPEYTEINRYKLLKEVETDNKPTSSLLSKKTNVIELLVWIAPDLYEFHANRLNLSSEELDEWIQTFSRSLTREVDLVFNSITTVSVRVYFSDVGYDTNLKTTRWFADNHFGTMLDAEASLNDFSTYISQRKHIGLVPNHDHVLILTRKSLAEYRSGKIRSKIVQDERDPVGQNVKFKIRELVQAYGRPYSICQENNANSLSIASISTTSYLQAIVQSIGIGFGIEDDFIQTPRDALSRRGLQQDNPEFRCSSTCEIKFVRHLMTLKNNCLQTGVRNSEFQKFLDTPRFTDSRYQSDRSQCETILGSRSKRCLQCGPGNCLNLKAASSSDETLDNELYEERGITVPQFMSSSVMTPSVSSFTPITMTSPINRFVGGDEDDSMFTLTRIITGVTGISSSTPIVSDYPNVGTPDGRLAGFTQNPPGIVISSSPFTPSTGVYSTFSSIAPFIEPVTEGSKSVDDKDPLSPDIIAVCLCCQLCGCESACLKCPNDYGTIGIPEALIGFTCDGDSPCCLRTDIDAG